MFRKYGIKRILIYLIIMVIGLAGCSSQAADVTNLDIEENNNIVVGFSQVGSESSWRVANSESMKSALSEAEGFELIFDDAKQKQENQYKSIRNFIQQQVDYIVLAPITETGWEDVLAEAREAGIPVIIVDRQVDVADESLYTTWVGSDFLKESQMAMEWLEKELIKRGSQDEPVNIFHVRGTDGATAQILRTKGLEEASEEHPNWNIVCSMDGEYTEAKGYEVTKNYLEKIKGTDEKIDVIYSENDNMTFGILRALKEEGIKIGGNDGVIIISFDAVKSSLEKCLNGEISLCVECNPLHGARVANLIRDIEDGNIPQKKSFVSENMFSGETLSMEIIEERPY